MEKKEEVVESEEIRNSIVMSDLVLRKAEGHFTFCGVRGQSSDHCEAVWSGQPPRTVQ